jgi:hypothetical protein
VSFEYVNFHYGVNACVGRRVVAYGEPGTIVKDLGHYIGVVLILRLIPHRPISPDRRHCLWRSSGLRTAENERA